MPWLLRRIAAVLLIPVLAFAGGSPWLQNSTRYHWAVRCQY
jgi:hypothetical protein